MAPHWWALRLIQAMEDRIVETILRQPSFHRVVGRIHRTIHERRHGRDPNDPLAPGEATADPNTNQHRRGFLRYFMDELKNQVSGKESKYDPPKK